MLKFTSIVGYTSCGATYIESFLTIFGQCINVLNVFINVLNYIDCPVFQRIQIDLGTVLNVYVHCIQLSILFIQLSIAD